MGKTIVRQPHVTEIVHFLPDTPMKEARTATGGSFYSNGQVVILKLDESAANSSPN
jgi:hypothetical protein